MKNDCPYHFHAWSRPNKFDGRNQRTALDLTADKMSHMQISRKETTKFQYGSLENGENKIQLFINALYSQWRAGVLRRSPRPNSGLGKAAREIRTQLDLRSFSDDIPDLWN